MKRTLKLLLLLGLVLLAKDKTPDGTTPGGTPNTKDPTTGEVKSDDQRKKDMDYNGRNAGKDFDGVLGDADEASRAGRSKQGQGTEPNTPGNNLPTRAELPPFNISPSQFGHKWGKHAKDYGLNPGDPASRQWFQDRANQVHDAPDDVRVGPYNPNGGGGPDYVFFRQGDDLVIMKPNGDFVTMFPMDPDNPNGWYQGATTIQ